MGQSPRYTLAELESLTKSSVELAYQAERLAEQASRFEVTELTNSAHLLAHHAFSLGTQAWKLRHDFNKGANAPDRVVLRDEYGQLLTAYEKIQGHFDEAVINNVNVEQLESELETIREDGRAVYRAISAFEFEVVANPF
jgi:hypothetical protein